MQLANYLRERIRRLSEESAKSSGSRKIEAGARIKELMRLKEASETFVKRRILSPMRPVKEKQFEQEVIKNGKEIDSPRSEPQKG